MNLLKALIHPIWQKLPQNLRRSVFEEFSRSGVSSVTPIRIDPLPQPITVAGYLTASTGLGQAARLAVLALEAEGYSVNIFDLTESLFHEKDIDFLRPKMVEGAGTLLLYVNPPVSSLALKTIGERLLMGKHRIGCWIWELPRAPQSWLAHVPMFHEIASSSHFAAQAISCVIGASVRQLTHPVAAEPVLAPPPRTDPELFRVGVMMDLGSRNARKNPDACVDAFALAFGPKGLNCLDKVQLDLKLLRPGSEPQRYAELIAKIATHRLPVNIKLDTAHRQDILHWLAKCDVMLSLHAAEGFGLACAEAMMMGVPCVATNWSATAEYIDASCGYPVDYLFVPAQDETGLYEYPDQQWAHADINSAAEQLREAYSNAADRATRGQAATARIQERFSSQAFCEKLFPVYPINAKP